MAAEQEAKKLFDEFVLKIKSIGQAPPAPGALPEEESKMAEAPPGEVPAGKSPCLDPVIQDLLLSFIREIPVCQEGQ